MRALVTGASGFVGHHLMAHLADAGDDATGCDRADGTVDILDPASVDAVIGASKPEVVYHLAGWADVGGSWANPRETLRANAEGTLNVLLACAEHGVGRVVAVSSADIYGPVSEADLPLTERSELRPVSPYAASKVAADYIGLQAWLGQGFEVVRARAFNHLGPGQSNKFVAAALAERVAANEAAEADEVTVGNLSPRRDFTDVRDVVRAYRLLATDGQPGEAYNVCSGEAVAVQELAERLIALADRPMRLVEDPDLFRPVDVPVLLGDSTKLRQATGWERTIDLDTTLGDLLDDMRRRVRLSAAP